jgi:hypothetical protein
MTCSTCETCAHWLPVQSGAFRGHCHGGVPTADPVDSRALWPVTGAAEFCGAHRARENGHDARRKP